MFQSKISGGPVLGSNYRYRYRPINKDCSRVHAQLFKGSIIEEGLESRAREAVVLYCAVIFRLTIVSPPYHGFDSPRVRFNTYQRPLWTNDLPKSAMFGLLINAKHLFEPCQPLL